MTSNPPKASTSRIFFVTDMTQRNAPVIPLGFMLEATWPDEARWLGLIGRTQLTPAELEMVNRRTWPELERPFDLLGRLFDEGWDLPWGTAAAAAQTLWQRSPLIVHTASTDDVLAAAVVDTDVGWNATTVLLEARLSLLGQKLTPYQPPHEPEKPRRDPPSAQRVPIHSPPKERRMREDFALAA